MSTAPTRPSENTSLQALLPRLRQVRHDIHKHPELGFCEHRTQELVRSWLCEHGYKPVICAKTGLYADLFPDRSPDSSGDTIALRADLDALPMQETTDLPYRSVNDGSAHKCGHDGHTTILMGVAAELASRRDQLAADPRSGNVRLIFQPAEEGSESGGGAQVMIAEGALDGVREIYGLHNWPALPLGSLFVTDGPMMADVHNLRIVLTGRGGHAAQPQACRDPLIAAAHLVTSLQTIVSRNLHFQDEAVLSICSLIAGGDANNVIPAKATMLGSLRSFDEAVRQRVLERVRDVVHGTARAFECEVELEIEAGYPVTINDPGCAAAVREVGAAVFGVERVSAEGLPLTASEDFAFLAAAAKGAYFLMGAGRPGESTPGCHHPDFDFEDGLILPGMRMFLGLVEQRFRAWSAS